MIEKMREPQIHSTAKIGDDVEIGDWSVIGPYAEIDGKVKIGRESYIQAHTIIGGGRKELGSLETGDFFYMGIRSMVNIADNVTIGDEVALGMDTKIFTHGSYLSEWDGFPTQYGPVRIGNRVWIPYAIIFPNVTIGDDVIVTAMSVVSRDIESGIMVGGVPLRAIGKSKGNYSYKDLMNIRLRLMREIFYEAKEIYNVKEKIFYADGGVLVVGKTTFNLQKRTISGPATKGTERVKDLLRRRGIRFKYYNNGGEYREWD